MLKVSRFVDVACVVLPKCEHIDGDMHWDHPTCMHCVLQRALLLCSYRSSMLHGTAHRQSEGPEGACVVSAVFVLAWSGVSTATVLLGSFALSQHSGVSSMCCTV